MSAPQPLQPTLWRSCRVLANRRRLGILHLLARESELAVSEIARRRRLPQPVASQYLRALEARGFLKVRRAGSRVLYRFPAVTSVEPARSLVGPLRRALERTAAAAERIYKLATAFTHPRRVHLFRALHERDASLRGLRTRLGISRFALARHLSKLQARGFAVEKSDRYSAATPNGPFAEVLARLARE